MGVRKGPQDEEVGDESMVVVLGMMTHVCSSPAPPINVDGWRSEFNTGWVCQMGRGADFHERYHACMLCVCVSRMRYLLPYDRPHCPP